MRDRIASWEGDSMTKETVDPLSGRKVKKNNSFESEARGFVAALPESIRERVLGNPQLADGLYSYSYNVGAGNFKKRVVPTLLAYYNGGATSDDVAAAMWASGDSKLRGLQKRRAVERGMVKDALWDTDMGRLNYASDNPQPSFTPYNPEVFSKVISGEYEPTMEEQGLQGN